MLVITHKYLLESGSWNACQELLAIVFKACDYKDSVLYAHLLDSSAALNGKRNNTAEALKLYEASKDIRERLLGPDHEELANTHNNIGLVLESYCRPQEALESFHRAIAIDMKKPEPERNKILHIRHLNVGFCLSHWVSLMTPDDTLRWADNLLSIPLDQILTMCPCTYPLPSGARLGLPESLQVE